MKSSIFCLLALPTVLCCCQQSSKTKDTAQSIIIDSTLRDSLRQRIQLVSDRHFSEFKTPIEARFFSNGLQTDSIIQSDFDMISWYSSFKDTIELVAHVGQFETEALLVKFIDRKPQAYFFRAPHLGKKYFKL